ncbi:MAG: VWA domain-containing protein [Bdellovibrionales bacterium]|nr:VWA domain-containing protein [Bdellovibrionales bacterium]
MKRTGDLLGVILAFVLLGSFGCQKNEPSFSLLPDSEIFFQNSGAVSPKIDLLWVVDNSGSMHSSQVNVANNFSSFITDFSSRGYDYRMAVIATDAYRELYTGSPTVSLFKSAAGTSIITPDTPDITNAFIDNIMVGTSGYGDERALQSMRVAMDNPNNSGLLRPDSFFAVIIVGDEDDFSHDGSDYIKNQYTAYTDPSHLKYNVAKGHTIEKYVEYLENLTGSSGLTKRFSVNSIVIKDGDADCLSDLSNGGGQQYGIRNQALAEASDGLVASLCADFAVELKNISENILTLSTQFFLKREPVPSSIVVTVNNEVIPSVESNPGPLSGGWIYNAEANSILFYGDYIPAAGAQISIDFDPVNLEI